MKSVIQETETLCWNLFLEYEKLMRLNSPSSPLSYFSNARMNEYRENAVIACIESSNKYHEFSGEYLLRVRRIFEKTK